MYEVSVYELWRVISSISSGPIIEMISVCIIVYVICENVSHGLRGLLRVIIFEGASYNCIK